MRVVRHVDRPIIDASTCDSIGTNIQGPSLVRMPDWAQHRLGRYHLYFADHKGAYIRMAHADSVLGPWTVHRPGSLQLSNSGFLTDPPSASDEEIERLRRRYEQVLGADYSADEALVDAVTPHIASPDVHVDHERRRFVMYFHGLESLGVQQTRVALSDDGIDFVAESAVLGNSYFRVFRHGGWWYALVMPGLVMRSRDGLTGFEPGPTLFEPAMRHSAVLVDGDVGHVFWTRVGDAPESILHSMIDMSRPWLEWRDEPVGELLRPERPWEGGGEIAEPSRRGAVNGMVNQLRDPCVLVDDGRTWLLYAAGGESGIGLVELTA